MLKVSKSQGVDYMTQLRRDEHGTEFSNWLRVQPEIDSSKGYVATNIDYVWSDYKRNLWMLIEEKRYGYHPSFYQKRLFSHIDRLVKTDINYKGFHVLIFERTNPDDGRIYLDDKIITHDDLIEFLQFKKPAAWYSTSNEIIKE